MTSNPNLSQMLTGVIQLKRDPGWHSTRYVWHRDYHHHTSYWSPSYNDLLDRKPRLPALGKESKALFLLLISYL